MADALEPCPFCGGEAREPSSYDKRHLTSVTTWHVIKCDKCPARVEYPSQGGVVAAWNRRAALPKGEPVAWRYRAMSVKAWSYTHDSEFIADLDVRVYRVEPLFAALSSDLSMAQATADTARKSSDHREARVKELERINADHCRAVNSYIVDNARQEEARKAAEARATALAAEVERLKAAVAAWNRRAALPKGEPEPVAWRVRVTDNGRTMYAYTERLPFEPMEGSSVKVRSEPEALVLAAGDEPKP